MQHELQSAVVIEPGQGKWQLDRQFPVASIEEYSEGDWVVVEEIACGLCGTDIELMFKSHGSGTRLVPGHEGLKRVIDVGPKVKRVKSGDFVWTTVRHTGETPFDRDGYRNHSTQPLRERGIFESPGAFKQRDVVPASDVIKVPKALAGGIGVLGEPESVCANALREIQAKQTRLGAHWTPERILVLGSGTISSLGVGSLRVRYPDAEVIVASRQPMSDQNTGAVICQEFGASYASLIELSKQRLGTNVYDRLREIEAGIKQAEDEGRQRPDLEIEDCRLHEHLIHALGEEHGNFDLVFEACTSASLAIASMALLEKNGAIALTTIPHRGSKRILPFTEDMFWDAVIGTWSATGVVNAADVDWSEGAELLAAMSTLYPGLLDRMITHRFSGLEKFGDAIELLRKGRDEHGKKPLKVCVDIAQA